MMRGDLIITLCFAVVIVLAIMAMLGQGGLL